MHNIKVEILLGFYLHKTNKMSLPTSPPYFQIQDILLMEICWNSFKVEYNGHSPFPLMISFKVAGHLPSILTSFNSPQFYCPQGFQNLL